MEISKADYEKCAQIAQGLTEDQQRAYLRNFNPLLILEELYFRMEWYIAYFDKEHRLADVMSQTNYNMGPFVDNAWVRKTFIDRQPEPEKLTGEVE